MKYDEDYLNIRIKQLRQMTHTISFIIDEIDQNYKGRAIALNEEHPKYDEYYDWIYRKQNAYPVFSGIQSGSPYMVTIRLIDSEGNFRPWNLPLDAIKLIE